MSTETSANINASTNRAMPLTASDLLNPGEAQAAGDYLRAELAESGEGTWSKIPNGLMGSRIEAALGDSVASIDLFGIFAQGWAKAVEIAALRDPAKNPPGKTAFLALGKIEQKLPINLTITLALGPLQAPPVNFVLEILAKFEAVELAIRDARIISAGGGKAVLASLLKYRQHKLSPEAKIKEFDLPGEHRFAEPGITLVEIKPAQPAPTAVSGQS